MKRIIVFLLFAAFGCGTFASYSADDSGKAKTELVKKCHDLIAIEVNQVIEFDNPAIQPARHITVEINVRAETRPKKALANAPPLEILEQSPQESHRIRAVTDQQV